MDKLLQVALLLISVYLTIVTSIKYQACNIHKLDCPPHSICSQLDHNESGECRCPQRFDVNPHSSGPSDYCVEDENSIGNGGSAAISSSSSLGGGGGKGSKTVVHIQPPAESHHVVIGILVPMMLVVLVIGAAYGIKKFHPVRRLREYVISRRRNRPLYEDVMMTQELEDPPLM